MTQSSQTLRVKATFRSKHVQELFKACEKQKNITKKKNNNTASDESIVVVRLKPDLVWLLYGGGCGRRQQHFILGSVAKIKADLSQKTEVKNQVSILFLD